jgi:UDP-N-acetyl-D-glucosamine dehydrogenase
MVKIAKRPARPAGGPDLLGKIKSHKARVVVIGQGYVGLPLAREIAEAGIAVTGYDINAQTVKNLQSGRSHIKDVPSAALKRMLKSGLYQATDNPVVLATADCVCICVPTPLSKTKDPDVSFILAAVETVVKYMHPQMLIVLESTTYPGTTEELIRPSLEAGGLRAGRDFYLAFSPERVDPGNPRYGTKNTPRIVGGSTPACLEIAAAFYEQFIDRVVPVSSTQAAEMVKLLENTFRSVNIGLVNEVALMCDRLKINVWEIIDAAATKPFGFMRFYPGPGLGGHCIPIDPHYLSWKLRSLNYYARFIELAGDINTHMPEYVVERIGRALNAARKAISSSTILILGVAYKRDIDDVRESPSLDVINLLERGGAKVSYHDPHVPEVMLDGGRKHSVPLTTAALRKADCVVILTDHKSLDYGDIVKQSQLVFDTRNATAAVRAGRDKIVQL